MSSLMQQDPEIGRAIQNEIKRQRANINLIASENFAKPGGAGGAGLGVHE